MKSLMRPRITSLCSSRSLTLMRCGRCSAAPTFALFTTPCAGCRAHTHALFLRTPSARPQSRQNALQGKPTYLGYEAVGRWEGVAVPAEASRAMFESAKGAGSRKQRRYDIFDAAFDAGHVRKVKKPKLQSFSPFSLPGR